MTDATKRIRELLAEYTQATPRIGHLITLEIPALLDENDQLKQKALDHDATLNTLRSFGIPETRARHLQTALSVYDSRMRKERDALKAEVERLREAIANELELPGGMPDEMWDAIKGDRDATEEGMRIVVRRTKQGILDAAAPEDE